MIIAQKITNQALLLRKCGFDERAEMLEDYVAEIDLASNVAVLELMRPEIFNNVLLDLTAPVFPAREVAIEDGENCSGQMTSCV